MALSQNPRINDLGLMQASGTDAIYVGVLGSSRTSAKLRERLKALDLTDAEIDRLHASFGLSIGSKKPSQNVIAILAEIIAVRKAAHRPVAQPSALATGHRRER